MKIDLTPLLSGEVDEIAIDYPLTIEGSFGGVAFPDPVRVLGTVTDKAGYTALKAKLHFRYDTVCDRCLRPVSVSGALEFSRTVALSGSLQNEDRDEYLIAENRMLDPDGVFTEEILLNLPMKHLCREDCKGLCQKCGKDLNEGPCTCAAKEIDPRLAGLEKLLKNKG
ncbi:MAG: DUF177 domain-containing protein [Clostridia bacterium]|nr:DUF177 domain-containing protein [Clostridia bacterium]